MKNALRWSLAATILFSLSGCGLKGPLYFPPPDKSTTQKTSNVPGTANDGSSQQKGVSPEDLTTNSRD
jgi:predicted small lipoprotein YifL